MTAVTFPSSPLSAETPVSAATFRRALSEFRSVASAEMVFGGPVRGTAPQRRAGVLEITAMQGNLTRSLSGLKIISGDGLGGKAVSLGRPVSVESYVAARGITHRYDRPVQAERLETVTAVPIVVARVPRMVVYLAHRTQVSLGDVWYDRLAPLARGLEREIVIADEVRRRLAVLQADEDTPQPAEPRLNEADLRSITGELAELAELVRDDSVRLRIEALRDRIGSGRIGPPSTGRAAPPCVLAAREIDVLTQVALGASNRDVGEALGLVENTVKSYLKTAMRKLHATNRVHAVRLAREAGLID